MPEPSFRDFLISHILPKVSTPGQYLGGELNSIRKSRHEVQGRLCLAFPDLYTIGMSHHGLQVLYSLMNARPDWACERVFSPGIDFERELRGAGLPLYGLETFTPLSDFDVLGFTLQYEFCTSSILTMLDLGGIPLHGDERTMADPLVIAGGPCAQNPEPLAPFIDLFVTGDGEPSLPLICDRWLELRQQAREDGGWLQGAAGRAQREEALAQLASELPFAYVPRFYEAEYDAQGVFVALHRTRADVPETIEPSVISDLDGIPLPIFPIVPSVECVHERIAIEIMRGCPWQCRFCQSTVIKRPMRMREVETIVQAALESVRNTGFNEVSLLSLSTSDYPQFEPLMRRMHEVLRPLGVNVSVPSLRVNEQLRSIATLLDPQCRNSLTLAPEVARDDMRDQIRKKIKNDDLYEGCRQAFASGFQQVMLYFLCGLPGEREVDLAGIVEMADTISRIGKQTTGRYAQVTASVSNFVPKAHTPYQWNGMKTREYFAQAHQSLLRFGRELRNRSVKVKFPRVEQSLLEGVLSRGDRTVASAIELAWRRGSRHESWSEQLDAGLWWQALAETGVQYDRLVHQEVPLEARLPWDHLNVKKGRTYLEKEQLRSQAQLVELQKV